MGLAFKPNIDDLRESPALYITKKLINENFNILAVEPNVEAIEDIVLVTMEDAIKNADIFVFLVAHKEFKNKIYEKEIIDFCNINIMYLKMKNVLFITLTIIMLSCKTEAKKENLKEEATPTEVSENVSEYPQVEDVLVDTNPVFTDGYEFTDTIGLEQIGVITTKENTYKLVYTLSKDSDFEAIEKLNVAFRVYPKNPELFVSQADRDAKAKTIATKCNIKNMEGDLVIISEEFTIIPREFEQVRVYFYHPEDGIIGKMITVLDIRFTAF